MTSLLQSFGLCQHAAHSQILAQQAGSAAEAAAYTGTREAIRHANAHQTSTFILNQNNKEKIAVHGTHTALREACWSLGSGKRQIGKQIVLVQKCTMWREQQIETEQYRVREIDDGEPIRNYFG